MLDEVRRYNRREKLLAPGEPVMVAVSGGVDSMVLLHVLRELGHPCSVVHVDHGLRGEASDGDRLFVEAHCAKQAIAFRAMHVRPAERADTSGLSTQMAARELRYQAFDELLREAPMPMALGHHADDAIETLFLHLLRGTGARGWSTIPARSGAFVRPLLCVDRAAISAYAAEQAIPFREDASNQDPKYLRNRIRHELIPLLEAMRPGAQQAMARSVEVLGDVERAARESTEQQLQLLQPGTDGTLFLPFDLLERSAAPSLLLMAATRHLGLHPDILDRIRDAVAERSVGSVFLAARHRLTVERDTLVITTLTDVIPETWHVPPVADGSAGPFTWRFEEADGAAVPTHMHEVVLDADRLTFPLELRPWRAGDRMRPIGLGGSQLVSDLLTNAKVPSGQRANTHVLVSAGTIVWLAGHRIAEGAQASTSTRRLLRIRLLK
jgi:tRNA(Ile)-lysidine synthase